MNEARGKDVKCVMGFLQRPPMSGMEPTKITNCLLLVGFKKQQSKAKQNRKVEVLHISNKGRK